MKAIPIALGVLGLLLISGCQTTQGLQTDDADLARRILAEGCVVGKMHIGKITVGVPSREGVVSKRGDGLILTYKHRLNVNDIHVYSVREMEDGWVIVDASARRTRDNLYFNRSTGEFACTEHEWRTVRSDEMFEKYEISPLIAPRF